MSQVERQESGTAVAKGNFVVPEGVAVEELDGGKKKLSEECPPPLRELLESKDLVPIYDKLVKGIVDGGSTRSVFGNWKDKEFDAILDLFRDEFAEKGVKVALCKRKSGSGTFRWLEFIDVEKNPSYVPQYDVSNFSGQVIKTCYTKIEFPNGVAVEELNRYVKARKTLKEKCPVFVEKMMTDKGLMEEYEALVDDLISANCGKVETWNLKNLNEVRKAHEYKFEKKGVSIFVCHKEEWISHGQHGGHMEYFRWLEFVDREEQPNYTPQRDVETKDVKCVIM
eukprot:CAMPEP_0197441050 /NCGR_PEP_ID=MMETSP1175-20131217/7413_1 /TAXON_ID=1003142 /ORGANISM="Triceratium dubium, Strain CCMP147" /LENGTH=281 /DNA_ID=CAMNT_0042971273 /DNA_START=38 /DNA_END=883 /DNA_ORIENTATION=+